MAKKEVEKIKKWKAPKILYGLQPAYYNGHYLDGVPVTVTTVKWALEDAHEDEKIYIYTLTETARAKSGKLIRKPKETQ